MPKRILKPIKFAKLKSVKSSPKRADALKRIRLANAERVTANEKIKRINKHLRKPGVERQPLVATRQALFNQSRVKEAEASKLRGQLKQQRGAKVKGQISRVRQAKK
ncbi:MAG: hypothetical protein BWY55_00574 [archaeon ADurb.Bin336]|nr:MAG: hypothetical protein BWY55_00574 [archaeon ADurb.Bin336]